MENNAPPPEGVVGRAINAIFGNPAMIPEAQRNFIPDPPRDVIVQGTQAIDAMQEFCERIKPYDLSAAVAFLKTRFYGQPMTARYRSQCATVLCQELDRQNVRDIHRRAQLVEEAVETHIIERIQYEPRWNADQIEAVNSFNDGIQGRAQKRSPYWYWVKDNIVISSDLNSKTPWQESTSFRFSHLIYPTLAVGGAIIGLAAIGYGVQKIVKPLISHLFATQVSTITIQSPSIQQALPLLTGTGPSSQDLMIQRLLEGFTSISENLSTINKNILDNNTLTQSTTQRVEDFINKQSMSWMEVAISRIWSPPSPS